MPVIENNYGRAERARPCLVASAFASLRCRAAAAAVGSHRCKLMTGTASVFVRRALPLPPRPAVSQSNVNIGSFEAHDYAAGLHDMQIDRAPAFFGLAGISLLVPAERGASRVISLS